MSELSCDTLFIGRNETHDLSRNRMVEVGCGHDQPTQIGQIDELNRAQV